MPVRKNASRAGKNVVGAENVSRRGGELTAQHPGGSGVRAPSIFNFMSLGTVSTLYDSMHVCEHVKEQSSSMIIPRRLRAHLALQRTILYLV